MNTGAGISASGRGLRIIAIVFSTGMWLPAAVWAQQFVHPSYVATDGSGNVYVSEPERHRVQKFDANGTFVSQWGSFGSANGQFDAPSGIVVDAAGNVYVADAGNSRIQKFTSTGVFVTKWGTRGVLPDQFESPTALAIDAAGNLYVTDATLKRIQVFSSVGTLLNQWGGQTGTGDGQFSQFQGPAGIAVDQAGNIYVSDTGNHRVQKFSANGAFLGWAGKCTSGASANCDVGNQKSFGFQCTASTCSGLSPGSANGQFRLPMGLAIDPGGNLYIVDTQNDRVQKFDSNGWKANWGSRGSAGGEFRQPIGGAPDATNNIYVADTGNNRVEKFDNTGAIRMVWGADVRLSASAGEAPGVVNPIVIRPSSGQGTNIKVESVNQFAGSVRLSALCCINAETGVGPGPRGVLVQLATSDVTVPSNGSASTVLDITALSLPSYGRWIARVKAENATLGVSRDIGIVFSVALPEGADYALSASPGQIPGIVDLFPSQTATSTIMVEPVNFGSARLSASLSATCCQDVIAQRWVNLTNVEATLSSNQVTVPPSGSATATLTIKTSVAPVFGKFLVPVTASSPDVGISHTTNVGFTVLPSTEPAPSCRSSTPVLPLKNVVQNLIKAHEGTAPTSPLVMAVFAPGATAARGDVWRWTFENSGSVTTDEAIVVLDNGTSWAKEITTQGCSSDGKTISVSGGHQDEMKITKADSTLIFRKKVCTFLCLSTVWRDVTVLAEPAFWTVFGGKKVTIRWVRD